MKKYFYTSLLIAIMVLGFVSCSNEDIPAYSGKDIVYFEWAKSGTGGRSLILIDSMSYSFAYQLPSVTDTTIKVPIKVQGPTKNTDRKVNLEVSQTSTAQAGVHYTIPETIVVPADSVRAIVPITLNRVADLKDAILSLKIELLANENFETSIYNTKEANNIDRVLSYTQFEITFSDILTQPAKWSVLSNWLGPWSTKKLYLLAEVNNMPVPDYNDFPDLVEFFAHVAVLKAYLKKQKEAGTPVLEDDKSEMVLGKYA